MCIKTKKIVMGKETKIMLKMFGYISVCISSLLFDKCYTNTKLHLYDKADYMTKNPSI